MFFLYIRLNVVLNFPVVFACSFSLADGVSGALLSVIGPVILTLLYRYFSLGPSWDVAMDILDGIHPGTRNGGMARRSDKT